MDAMFSPSLMCMDFMNIGKQLEILNSRCDMYHVDIMDGHYVKNITLSPCFVEQIAPHTKKDIDCHLMVTNPSDYVKTLAKAGAGYISPHAETINADAFRIINMIKEAGCKLGIVLNPSTPLDILKYYIEYIDKLTLMTVDPGFAGQKFVKEVVGKVKEASELKKALGYKYLIEIDGSCNKNTFNELSRAGAEVFIVGTSGLFGLDKNLETAWDIMKNNWREVTDAKR